MVRTAQLADWPAVRDIRLRALADAPAAFGSTLARELAFDDAEWQRRVAPVDCILALVGGEPIGMVSTMPEAGRADERHLVGMWVDPRHRGTQVATRLMEAVFVAAAAGGALSMSLWVADGNPAARRLYERMGFTGTGERQPLPSNPAIGEERMRRAV